MLRTLQEKAELLNSQYIEYNDSINRLSTQLQTKVEALGFATADLEDAKTYIQDRVTLFRYLRYSDFDENKAIERIMDTILWRRESNIAHLTWQSVPTEFFENGFAFFHKHDRLNRPVAVVRMRYFPQFRDKSKTLTELIRPYACLVMEMARRMMLDITAQREQQGEAQVLVSQIAVIIDIGKAPFIPIDTQLVQAIMEIMDKRFPGFVGSIYVMNFGWMYQGLWQMIKYLLSDEARSRISFPSAKEVLEIVPEENLLEELGGKDDYIWGFENDTVLEKYGHGSSHVIEQSPHVSPVLTPSTRPSRSVSLSSDEFFDAPSYIAESESSLSAYATPGTMTPVTSVGAESGTSLYLPVLANRRIPLSNYTNIYNWTGLHMGAAFLTSFLGTRSLRYPMDQGIDGLALANRLAAVQQEQLSELREDKEMFESHELAEFRPHTPHFPHLLPPDDPHSAYALAPVRMQVVRIEQKLLRLTRRLFRLSFAYKGAIYWVLLYIFLRGPVEHVVRRSVAAIISTPQKVTYTTIGVTAAMAAAIGSSITASLGLPP